MKIMINSDSSVNVDQRVQEYIQDRAQEILDRFENRVTRIKVHLSDETNNKPHRYFKCSIEARLEHLKPVAVTAESDSLDQAIDDGLDKTSKLIEHTVGRYKDTHSHEHSSKQNPLQEFYSDKPEKI